MTIQDNIDAVDPTKPINPPSTRTAPKPTSSSIRSNFSAIKLALQGLLDAVNALITSLLSKQDTLVSGVNLRTVNGNTLLGSGDITVSGGGGLTNFAESVNTAAPNNTVPIVYLAPANAAANVDIALVPKGSGGFALQVADGSVIGGKKRGVKAVDMQTSRLSNISVASGDYSVLGGGNDNEASGLNSTVGGGSANKLTSKNSASPGGSGALSWINGAMYFSGDCYLLQQGDTQRILVLLKGNAINATPKVLTTDGASPSSSASNINQISLGAMANCSVVITGSATAKQGGSTNSAGWIIQIAAVCSSAGAITIKHNSVAAMTGNAAWLLVAAVDSANQAIKFTFTGASSADIVVAATLDISFSFRA